MTPDDIGLEGQFLALFQVCRLLGISQLHGFLSNWFVFARLGPGDPLSTHLVLRCCAYAQLTYMFLADDSLVYAEYSIRGHSNLRFNAPTIVHGPWITCWPVPGVEDVYRQTSTPTLSLACLLDIFGFP